MKKFIYLSLLGLSMCLASCTNATTPNSSTPTDSSAVEQQDRVVTKEEFKAAAAKLPARKEAGVLKANLTGPMTITSNASATITLADTSDTSDDTDTSFVSQFDMTFTYYAEGDAFVLDEDNSTYDPLLEKAGFDTSIYAEMFEEGLTDNIAAMIDSLEEVDEATLEQVKLTLLGNGGFKAEVEQEQSQSMEYYSQTTSSKVITEYNSEGFLAKLYEESSTVISYGDAYKQLVPGLTDSTVKTSMDTAVTYTK